jgi:N-acetylglucosaminyldiphosphoundecaprenol N-acetyl-beta-D-mannosaminyltransferase
MSTLEPPRVNILGVGVSAINMETALRTVRTAIETRRRGYVCVTGVHGIMESQRDVNFGRLLNASLLTTPDGMPTVWLGRWQGYREMDRVYGPDLMLGVCAMSERLGFTQFLYGGRADVAERLQGFLRRRFPRLRVLGCYTPPFRPLNGEEEAALAKRIAVLRPDIMWIGLSTPKQERFMAEFLPKLDLRLMVGVGATFDILTGGIQDAPRWVKRAGLQWLHRLSQEPSRLWKRYLLNNPRFLWHIGLQLARVRSYRILNE